MNAKPVRKALYAIAIVGGVVLGELLSRLLNWWMML